MTPATRRSMAPGKRGSSSVYPRYSPSPVLTATPQPNLDETIVVALLPFSSATKRMFELYNCQ